MSGTVFGRIAGTSAGKVASASQQVTMRGRGTAHILTKKARPRLLQASTAPRHLHPSSINVDGVHGESAMESTSGCLTAYKSHNWIQKPKLESQPAPVQARALAQRETPELYYYMRIVRSRHAPAGANNA